MFLKQIFMCVCGLSFGFLASAGVFTVLVSVGLIPRFAGKMHVAKKVFMLEEAVVLGTLTGGFCSVFYDWINIGSVLREKQVFGGFTEAFIQVGGNLFFIIFGIFAGMFVGCLALAIAEMLNSIPIFARRIGFRHGLGVAVTAAALGKLAGSLIYFAKGVFLTGQ